MKATTRAMPPLPALHPSGPSSMSLDPTLGAVELGAIFSTLLFGIITVQAFDYYRDYPNDSWTLKAMVGSIWLFELGHMILVWHATYRLTITLFGQSAAIYTPPCSLYMTLVFSGLVATIVRIFFAHRIRVFSATSFVTVVCWVLTCLDLVAALAVVAVFYRHGVVFVLAEHYRWLLSTSLVLGAVVDVLISASLCYCLWSIRLSGLTNLKTKRIVDTVITWSIESTLVKSAAALLELILFLTRDDLSWVVFYLIQSALYSNSMLVSLNGRHRIAGSEPAVNDTGPPTLLRFNVDGMAPQAAVRPRNMVIQMSRLTEIHVDVEEGGVSKSESKHRDDELNLGQWRTEESRG
ncbi:hypothetical protein B0H13DRAFT_2655019 [Mycena leptocephala]|nr:hypothetical protein B0H13DRAFT_2655019 [Mycena leptocephala]